MDWVLCQVLSLCGSIHLHLQTGITKFKCKAKSFAAVMQWYLTVPKLASVTWITIAAVWLSLCISIINKWLNKIWKALAHVRACLLKKIHMQRICRFGSLYYWIHIRCTHNKRCTVLSHSSIYWKQVHVIETSAAAQFHILTRAERQNLGLTLPKFPKLDIFTWIVAS